MKKAIYLIVAIALLCGIAFNLTNHYVIASQIAVGYLQIPSDGALYLGDSSTDGSWKYIISGSDLIVQKRVSGSWVTKRTISGS
jgi:hypothetical protein